MTYTVDRLRKMRKAARDVVLAENPELRDAWEKEQENPIESPTFEQIRKADRDYLYNFGER